MRSLRIDNIDLMILKALYRNARITLTELSSLTGISITAVRNRLDKLMRYGVILGFYSDIDFSKLGYSIRAFTGIKAEPRCRRDVIKYLLTNPRVLRVHEVTGDFDLLVEFIAKDLNDLREFLTTDMVQMPGVIKTNTMIILRSYGTMNPFK